jgi:imidazolonepropionase-like amidohydrolase
MIVIRGGTLIDGTGRPPIENSVIVIDGDKIHALGRASDVMTPSGPGVTELDARGKTILPGLIDAHDHLSSHGYDLASRMGLTKPLSLIHLEIANTIRDTLLAGITTVRDAAWLDVGFKQAVDQGIIPGPRLRVAISIISPTGGVGDRTTPSGQCFSPPGIPFSVADGVDAARQKVREMVRAGADVIKTATTGGVSTPRRGPLDLEYTRTEIDAIVDEARLLGKRVMCHALGAPGIRVAVEAGVHSIEHGSYIDEDPDVIRMMADQGTFYVPTFMVYRYHGSERAAPFMQKRAQAMREHHIRSVQEVMKHGVRVAMGTDAGGYVHGQNAMELQLLVEAGMSPMEAIVASTKTAAECLEMEKEVGTLEPGKLADLLVVAGDPLKDITLLQQRENLALIMKGGEPVVDRLSATTPRPLAPAREG